MKSRTLLGTLCIFLGTLCTPVNEYKPCECFIVDTKQKRSFTVPVIPLGNIPKNDITFPVNKQSPPVKEGSDPN